MKINFYSFDLELKHPFTISGSSRTHTPLLFVEISYGGFSGIGEAAMVPYMDETQKTAVDFLKSVDLSWLTFPFSFDELHIYLNQIRSGNTAIKAAIDIALHDLTGKISGKACFELFDSDSKSMPPTSHTIGMDSMETIIKKVKEAKDSKILKIKLGSKNDCDLINGIRAISGQPIYADANQGWKNKHLALEMAQWLFEQGVVLIEQPLDKGNFKDHAWLNERSPIPIIADEAIQNFSDVEKAVGAYAGINIKLMKCGGMSRAFQMIKKARQLNLKILMGCMTESSCATLAAASLAPLCDWADLDGPFLIANNPFEMPLFNNGKWDLQQRPGLGLNPQIPAFFQV